MTLEAQIATIHAHKFCKELMNEHKGTVEIKICFNSYRKTPYGYAIKPILVQLFDKTGKSFSLKQSDLKQPIKEIYVKIWKIPTAHLHCITYTPNGEFFNYFLENFTDEEYQKIARNMKIMWYLQPLSPMQAPSFPLKIEGFKLMNAEFDDIEEEDEEKNNTEST